MASRHARMMAPLEKPSQMLKERWNVVEDAQRRARSDLDLASTFDNLDAAELLSTLFRLEEMERRCTALEREASQNSRRPSALTLTSALSTRSSNSARQNMLSRESTVTRRSTLSANPSTLVCRVFQSVSKIGTASTRGSYSSSGERVAAVTRAARSQ